MLALSFNFLAGRYHATPWDRHVNEGAVAWPPEPWRLLRGLIATWHHKIEHTGEHSEKHLQQLVESLAQELPDYTLPVASHSHTRHYMPQFRVGNTSLIFDAFAAIDRDDPLVMTWPSLELPKDQLALLDDLLAMMGYLGRAESWVEARRINDAPEPNCQAGTAALDRDTGEQHGEIITLYAPQAPDAYQTLRANFLTDKKAEKKLGKTLPDNLLDALRVDTAALRKQGWNQPPAARKVSYIRPLQALQPQRKITRTEAPTVTTAQFILIGKSLPRVEDSLRIGEIMRIAVMSTAKHLLGEASIPAIFSGHDLPKNNRHGHAFYIPWSSRRDGRIDRVLVHVPDGMPDDAQLVIKGVRKIWSSSGGKWEVVLENTGGNEIAPALTKPSKEWQSITPYLHPWHWKKKFTIEDQIRRECHKRGFPPLIELEAVQELEVGRNRKLRCLDFHRFRTRRGLTQPDRHGSFWHLTFAEPVAGPLALGFACHYGLGMFRPVLTPTKRKA